MTILLDAAVPERGPLHIRIHVDTQINVPAAEARQRVTQFVHRQLSSQMHGGPPVLVLRERAVWRVPIHLTFPSVGDVGQVGELEVDVETGTLDVNETVLRKLEENAEALARRSAAATTR